MLAYGSETLQFFDRKCWFSLLIRVVNPSIHLTQRTCVSGCDEAHEDYNNPCHQGNQCQQGFVSCSILRSLLPGRMALWAWRGSGFVLRCHKPRGCPVWGGMFFFFPPRELSTFFHHISLWVTDKPMVLLDWKNKGALH